MRITLNSSLPVFERDEWDGDSARRRILAWAGYDNADTDEQRGEALERAAQLFLFRRDEGNTRDDLVAPCGDIIDGEPRLVTSGLRYALAAVNGARGGIDAPAELLERARDLIQSILQDQARGDDAKSLQIRGGRCEIKSVGDKLILRGYAVIWGGRDLDGDTFPPDADLGEGMMLPAYPILYEHGQHPIVGKSVLGRVFKVERDEIGLLIEAELDRHNRYLDLVLALAEQGALGLSTGAVAHLVERNGNVIKSWVIAEVSITPTPAEPRTLLHTALKSDSAHEANAGGESHESGEVGDKPHSGKCAERKEEIPMFAIENKSKSFGDFVKSAWSKALSTVSGPAGGYLVPQEFVDDLFGAVQVRSFVLERAFVIRAGGEIVQPSLDFSKGGIGKQSFFGGFSVSFFAQNAQAPESDPAFSQYVLRGLHLGARTRIPNALLRSSRTAELLTAWASGAIADAIDRYALTGTGSGEFLGILNAPATITVTRQTAGEINARDIARMYVRHYQFGRNSSMWLVSPTAYEQIVLLTLGDQPVFQPNFAEGASGTLMGLPVIKTNWLPAVGAKGDVVLVDWNAYALQIADDVEVAMSEHQYFDYDQTVMRVIIRCDGQPRINAPIADPVNTTPTTLSPFVVLQ